MTDEILQYVQQLQGIVIVRAGMGSGKSTGLLRPLMHNADRGVSVAHRVSLIGGLWEMMTEQKGTKADILHYRDPGYQEMAPYANKLTICINSIVKGCWQPLMRQHDYFGFDEATQGLRAILSGRAMENPVAVFNTLIDALARTELHPIMVDADANDLLVDTGRTGDEAPRRNGPAGMVTDSRHRAAGRRSQPRNGRTYPRILHRERSHHDRGD